MNQNSQDYEDGEIDLIQYIRIIFKHKNTFLVIFLLTLAFGLTKSMLSPKIYRSSMLIQPPAVGMSLTGANDIDSAENLKALIVNKAFNEEVYKRLKLYPIKDAVEFKVDIPKKTNILQVSIDLERKNKESGMVLLQNLNAVIAESYAKRIEAEYADIASQTEFKKRAIINTENKAKNFQEQIKEIIARKNKLNEEMKSVNANASQTLEKLKKLPTGDKSSESASMLLLSNYLQNNANYLNQLNKELSALTIRLHRLNMKLQITTSQISDSRLEIDNLNIKNNFISNLKTIAQPRVSEKPINSIGKQTVVTLIALGLFLGLIAVFLQEFWLNNMVKK
ncbi:MAG: Wzz/FepE/Etk N-terminal domain-containing protein [Candidatus Omnitrophota bacterium]